MFSVLVIRLRSLRLLRVSGIVMRLRMFLLLITFLKASHSFRNRLLVICKNAYLFAIMNMTSGTSPFSFCSGIVRLIFISSRRRHTRSLCDWSSDVCSSDLFAIAPETLQGIECFLKISDETVEQRLRGDRELIFRENSAWVRLVHAVRDSIEVCGGSLRSEERRVGKEWRSRWSPYH